MSLLILLTLFLTVFSFLGIVGSEEYNSGPRVGGNRNYDDIYSHEHFITQPRGTQNTYHNHNGHHYDYPTRNSNGAPNFPPGFQHDPKYHSSPRSSKNIGVAWRQDDPSTTTTEVYTNSSINQIPQFIFEKYDELDIEDFLNQYVEGYEKTPTVENRFGDEPQPRNGAIRAVNGACMIEKTAVPLINYENPNIFYVPRCTRIERCKGCCGNKKLTCQAVEQEIVSVEVVKSTYVNGNTLTFIGKEVIPLERHTKCKCECSLMSKDCGPLQAYNKDNCSCYCTNTDEEAKCYSDSRKEWDPNTCTCNCRGLLECSTGSIYDHNECKCKHAAKRRYAPYGKPRNA